LLLGAMWHRHRDVHTSVFGAERVASRRFPRTLWWEAAD
jgi:hypothetical protein